MSIYIVECLNQIKHTCFHSSYNFFRAKRLKKNHCLFFANVQNTSVMVIGKMIMLHTLESLHKYFYLSDILNEALLSNRINIGTLKQYFIFLLKFSSICTMHIDHIHPASLPSNSITVPYTVILLLLVTPRPVSAVHMGAWVLGHLLGCENIPVAMFPRKNDSPSTPIHCQQLLYQS